MRSVPGFRESGLLVTLEILMNCVFCTRPRLWGSGVLEEQPCDGRSYVAETTCLDPPFRGAHK